MLDMIIKGGRVVTPSGVGDWDVALQGEKIVAVALPGVLPEEGARIIDAGGKIVVPGGIEPHAHAAANVQPGARQSVSGTPNAGPANTPWELFGAAPPPWWTLLRYQMTGTWRLASTIILPLGRATPIPTTQPTVFTATPTLPTLSPATRNSLTPAFPASRFLPPTYAPPMHPSFPLTPIGRIDAGRLQDVMEQIARHGGVLAVHGEDDELVMYNYLLAQQRGQWDWHNVHLIHSKTVEDLAFRSVLRLAERTGVGLYFVHVTAQEGLDAISEARSRRMPVYGEVLTLALSFHCGQYREEDGMKYHTYPSLKYEEDRQGLWDGLLRSDLSFTATDSSFTTYLDKIAGRNVVDIRGGNIGIEIRMGVNYTEGVVKRGMSLEHYAAATSTNAAKVLGMYPRKGAIAVGSDADITIIDPSIKKALTMDDLHLRDYSPWEGWDVEGWPTTVILRGNVMVDNGQLVGGPTMGRLVPRKIDPGVLNRPAF